MVIYKKTKIKIHAELGQNRPSPCQACWINFSRTVRLNRTASNCSRRNPSPLPFLASSLSLALTTRSLFFSTSRSRAAPASSRRQAPPPAAPSPDLLPPRLLPPGEIRQPARGHPTWLRPDPPRRRHDQATSSIRPARRPTSQRQA